MPTYVTREQMNDLLDAHLEPMRDDMRSMKRSVEKLLIHQASDDGGKREQRSRARALTDRALIIATAVGAAWWLPSLHH